MTETFRNLVAWQKAKALAKDIYLATRTFPKEETYGLTIQMRRAAVSIPSNIAEGKGRNTRKDYCHFLIAGARLAVRTGNADRVGVRSWLR